MEILVAALVLFCGAFVQSSIGFGLAIIAAPVLYLINPDFIPAPITLCALALSLVNAWGHRASISMSGLQYAIIGRVPGTIAGGMLLLWISQDDLALWLGVTVLFAVCLSLNNVALKPSPKIMMGAGFLSGFMGTSSSIGGPPLVLVLQYQDADYIRANMSAFFVVSCLMSLVVLFFIGRFGMQELQLGLPLLIPTLLGYWVAKRTLHVFSHQILRRCALVLCAFAGLIAIASFWA